eukprot:gene5088-6984_t
MAQQEVNKSKDLVNNTDLSIWGTVTLVIQQTNTSCGSTSLILARLVAPPLVKNVLRFIIIDSNEFS